MTDIRYFSRRFPVLHRRKYQKGHQRDEKDNDQEFKESKSGTPTPPKGGKGYLWHLL
jgi:hypothetical protein